MLLNNDICVNDIVLSKEELLGNFEFDFDNDIGDFFIEENDIDDFSAGIDISEALLKNAIDFGFDDDFLVEEDEQEIVPLEMDDDEVQGPVYFGNELQNIVSGFDYTTDIFVVNPRKKIMRKKPTMNQNYLVNRIEHTRSFYLLCYKERNNITTMPNYLNYANLIDNLKKCIDLYNFLCETNQDIIPILLLLERLLCYTYITKSDINDSKDYFIKDNHLIPCLWVENKYNNEQLMKLKSKIHGLRDDKILIEVSLKIYMTKFEKDILNGLDKLNKTYLSKIFDKYIDNKLSDMINKVGDDDILDLINNELL